LLDYFLEKLDYFASLSSCLFKARVSIGWEQCRRPLFASHSVPQYSMWCHNCQKLAVYGKACVVAGLAAWDSGGDGFV